MGDCIMVGLARQLVACPAFRWMPGMRILEWSDDRWPSRLVRCDASGRWDAMEENIGSWLRFEAGRFAEVQAVPDLTDPATAGCLLHTLIAYRGNLIDRALESIEEAYDCALVAVPDPLGVACARALVMLWGRACPSSSTESRRATPAADDSDTTGIPSSGGATRPRSAHVPPSRPCSPECGPDSINRCGRGTKRKHLESRAAVCSKTETPGVPMSLFPTLPAIPIRPLTAPFRFDESGRCTFPYADGTTLAGDVLTTGGRWFWRASQRGEDEEDIDDATGSADSRDDALRACAEWMRGRW